MGVGVVYGCGRAGLPVAPRTRIFCSDIRNGMNESLTMPRAEFDEEEKSARKKNNSAGVVIRTFINGLT